MSCGYCDSVEVLHGTDILSDSYVGEESATCEVDGATATLTVHTWLDDENCIVQDFPISFCPVCGRRLSRERPASMPPTGRLP